MTGRALVTGASGVLGTATCRDLAAEGWTVRGSGRGDEPPAHLAGNVDEWRSADVRSPENCRAAVRDCSVVVHLAGVGLADADPATVAATNRRGTEHVLDACAGEADAVERVVVASTAGLRRTEGVATEADLARPVGAYQRSKAAGESAVRSYIADGGDAVVVRPTSVFGPGDRAFTARLCRLALATPPSPATLPGGASFVAPADVAGGIRAAIERGEAGREYVLGGENLTYGEALGVIAAAGDGRRPRLRVPRAAVVAAGHAAAVLEGKTGRRVFPFDPAMARLATSELFYSSARARRELGYSYRPLSDHVDDAVEWYRGRGGDEYPSLGAEG
ncbi:SDR family NAD(P)-dependent oxidoreductase (plasmid) [Halobaculum sp. CBA1158]|uniref:SDR family NAD(P)-dependent oxidoreductase n=1 Tax=Halobaculum sp. CBA1158 TaxID=2904243 RepID=UPI001F2D844B|nr:SDR family NAD(P)-dependent oxidoreductase [Halobaculum sp. CBA1158]UIP01459.1 SDR family NAD(P)-dependent oxidoreductase [Halobaculum sp. CBA1158]